MPLLIYIMLHSYVASHNNLTLYVFTKICCFGLGHAECLLDSFMLLWTALATFTYILYVYVATYLSDHGITVGDNSCVL